MSSCVKRVFLGAFVLVLLVGLPAAAQARVTYTTSKPGFSMRPVSGVPFTVSGVITPKSTSGLRAAVRVKLYRLMDGHYDVVGTYSARFASAPKGTPGTTYKCRVTVRRDGRHAVRAFHYRGGKLVSTSKTTPFTVAQRIDVDSNVNGWLAPALGDTMAPAGKPLDIVFSTPADWAAPRQDGEPLHGAAHFIWGDFRKVDADGLIWHTSGLTAGRYDWMRDAPEWGTGSLVVAQKIAIDKVSHRDSHALPYLPADISFGRVTGCDRSIAFLTGIFAKTSSDPLVWHTDGMTPGRYDWKCWMPNCHYGTLVADATAQVTIASDPDETATAVPANAPLDIVFTGGTSSMMCWRTIHFTTAGDFTKTSGYPDPLTWRTGELAPGGTYEWQCWMGPTCHHGTIVVQ